MTTLTSRLALFALFGLAACGSDTEINDGSDIISPGNDGPIHAPGVDDQDGVPGDEQDDLTAPDVGVEKPGDTDDGGAGDTGSVDGGDTGAPISGPVRFIAIGDGGHGNPEQYAVAAGIEKICAAQGCEFVIYAGDNIYSDGVSSVDDPQFEEKFEAPYANLDMPFYMALGNHDWNQGFQATEYQVEYSARSEKWTMPDQYYSFDAGDVSFFALDSQPIKDGDIAPQQEWITQALAGSNANWKIAFAHHPYLSNGDHGDTGGDFGAFFEENLCGKVDVYIAGHDHDLQWLQPACGTEHIVSGAASSLRDTGMGSNPTYFETSTLGFMWIEIDGNTFTGVFYDQDGNELFRRTMQK